MGDRGRVGRLAEHLGLLSEEAAPERSVRQSVIDQWPLLVSLPIVFNLPDRLSFWQVTGIMVAIMGALAVLDALLRVGWQRWRRRGG